MDFVFKKGSNLNLLIYMSLSGTFLFFANRTCKNYDIRRSGNKFNYLFKYLFI